MIICLEGWDGHFDVDLDFRPGSPASFGPNGGDPGDPDELRIDGVEWHFRQHDSIYLLPGQIGDALHEALLNHAYAHSKPEDFAYDDYEF